MQTTIANMQSTFFTELKKIKAQNEQNNKKVASRIEKSEQEFQKSQEAILAEFTRMEKTLHPSPRIFCQTRRRSLRHQDRNGSAHVLDDGSPFEHQPESRRWKSTSSPHTRPSEPHHAKP
jgi:hypothetical protein